MFTVNNKNKLKRAPTKQTAKFPQPIDFIDLKTQGLVIWTLNCRSPELNLDWSNALIWMDTQGREGPIFEGAKRFFLSQLSPKAIVSEFWPYDIERSGSRNAYFKFLTTCFAIYDLNSPEWKRCETVSVSVLNDMYEVMLKSIEKEYYPHADLLLIIKYTEKFLFSEHADLSKSSTLALEYSKNLFIAILHQ